MSTALAPEIGTRAPPARPSTLDVVMGVLAVVLVTGFFIDLWAHSHGRVDETFFTPWHGISYAGALLHGVVLSTVSLRRREQGLSLRRSVPDCYGLSFVGAALFLVAGIIDLGWHEVFGFEVGTDALLSPSHLLLATSGIFMVSGPIRSAWSKGVPQRFPGWLPWVFALTMSFSILTSFTEYAHPAIETWPGMTPVSLAERSSLLLVEANGRSQTRVPLDVAENVWLPDFFPDGSRLVVSTSNGETGALYIIDRETWEATKLWEGSGEFHHPEVSPDGSRVVFTAPGPDDSPDIFLIDVNDGSIVQLTDSPAVDWGPTWSPDGTSITFVSDRDGDGDLYTIPSAGGETTQLTNLEGNEASPSWSPDSSRIAFDSGSDFDLDVFVMNADGSGLTALAETESTESGPSWSPDGRSIAFSSNGDGNVDLYLFDLDSGESTNLTRNPAAHEGWGGIAWADDGSIIATNTSGWMEGFTEPFVRESLGVASMLVQAALIAAVLLLILGRGPLPVGAMTVILTFNAALMTLISDNYWYIAPALAAGFLGDVVAYATRHLGVARRARILAAIVPAAWYAGYLGAVAVTQSGLGWSIHMILGAPLIAGAVGLLMSLLVFRPEAPAVSDAGRYP
jgi:Tol biopolymer transport system component